MIDQSPMDEYFVFPTSFPQQRLWFLDQMAPGTPLYNISTGVPLNFPVKSDRLHRCVNEIIQRHEVLRTTFRAVHGEPCQVVAPVLQLTIAEADLSQLSPEQREAQQQDIMQQEILRPFDLSEGPLIRAKLIKLAHAKFLLLVSMHHIISDGWSIGIFFQELRLLYEAMEFNRAAPLPALPIQYADYAVWQRNYLQEEVLQRQLTYWKNQLEGADELNLPTDRPRPPVQSYHGASEQVIFPVSLYAAVKQLSVKAGVTPFMTLLAAFKLLLHYYANQTDIVVGTPIAGRNKAELENLIGFFVNTLVLRTDLSGNPTFGELLARVRINTVNAFEQQDVPFEKLVEELQVKRDISRNPVFQVTFQLINTATLLHQNVLAQSSISASDKIPASGIKRGTAMFDLAFDIAEIPEGLLCQIEYSTNLFNPETIRTILSRYEFLLEKISTGFNHRISDLRYFPVQEELALLDGQNAYTVEPKGHAYLHRWFERTAEQNGDKECVVFDGQSFTFAAVNNMANAVAHHLLQHGVKHGAIVGVGCDSSLDFIIAVLAVLKIGGAFLPLDPDHPAARLTELEQYTDWLLGDTLLKDKMAASTRFTQIEYNTSNNVAYPNPTDGGGLPDVLAYVLFTSGSTGKPKGVMISHRAIVNHMEWMKREFPLLPTDRVLQRTAFGFDASIWEIFAPLVEGATLVLVPRRLKADVAALTDILDNERITIAQFVPTILQWILDRMVLSQNRYLRRIFCGGEMLGFEKVKQLMKQRAIELINLYGPTECTIDATYKKCRLTEDYNPVPIGQPISNTRIYILDRYLNPVPIGFKGEIYIGGKGLAEGYIRQPGMTAERFMPDPFSTRGGERMYRTGDMGKWISPHEIQCLGRTDDQVKLRGYRIELAEIETAIKAHGDIQDVAVMLREDHPGNQTLVAYYCLHAGSDLTVAALQLFVKERLPSYMMPMYWVVIETMPTNASGKVNRHKLPAPDTSARQLTGRFAAPANAVEQVIADIWMDVLNLDEVGVHHNFFSDLGGHSLLATQLMSRVRDMLAVQMPLQRIFEYPTIHEFAEAILQEAPDPKAVEVRSEALQKNAAPISP